MKKSFFAYLSIGLAISICITYIIIDMTSHAGIRTLSISAQPTLRADNNHHIFEVTDDVPIFWPDNGKDPSEDKNESTSKDDDQDVNEDEDLVFIPVFKEMPIDDQVFNLMDQVSYHNLSGIALSNLRLLQVSYYDFQGDQQTGRLIVHYMVATDILEIFTDLYEARYPIDKVRLVHNYEGLDDLSMADNNSHAFNDRLIGGSSKISNHAYGLAIDINPIQNPYVAGRLILPPEGESFVNRNIFQQGMILKGDICYNAFISRGWQWGGDWSTLKDYQHFEKIIPGVND